MNRSLRKLVSFSFASKALVIINSLVIVLHLLVIFGVIPYTIVWGGRLQSPDQMYGFEMASILVNVLLVIAVLLKNKHTDNRIINGVLWLFVVIFALNTVGNLAAVKQVEMLIATPITFLLSVLCWRVAIEKQRFRDDAFRT